MCETFIQEIEWPAVLNEWNYTKFDVVGEGMFGPFDTELDYIEFTDKYYTGEYAIFDKEDRELKKMLIGKNLEDRCKATNKLMRNLMEAENIEKNAFTVSVFNEACMQAYKNDGGIGVVDHTHIITHWNRLKELILLAKASYKS